MKTTKLRTIVPVTVIVLVAVGFATNYGIGTLSTIGWQDISLLCPLGALTTMLASKTLVPRAVISLILAFAAILLLGRAFCAWICPAPIVSKLRDLFKPKAKAAEKAPLAEGDEAPLSASPSVSAPLSAAEQRALASSCGKEGCESCTERRGGIDARHFVLGGSLLSAAVFGFPVFCLVCPVGLTFASVLLIMRLFANGDMTWAVVVVPALLIVELVLFRKWCHRFCPLGALMSLTAKLNRTFVPAIDDSRCLETTKNATCGRCATACAEGINPRHPDFGTTFNECTKCRACAEACPTKAITLPFLPKRRAAQGAGQSALTPTPEAVAFEDAEEATTS